jgi:DNA mismatch repair ATPase MutS
VGRFYEVGGIDAILLAEHLGLALMGGEEVRVAKAGLPVQNLAAALRTLVRQKGYEVVSDAGRMRRFGSELWYTEERQG